MTTLEITTPDDWHVHLRDGHVLKHVVKYTARYFGRALVMPNLKPPVLTAADALAYRERIIAASGELEPLMTIKIAPTTTPDIVREAKAAGILAGKLYPDGVTTNSEGGVRDFTAMYPVFEAMQDCGLVLSLHGEVPDPDVDCYRAENIFVREILSRLERDFPRLNMVLEHITTAQAVWHVMNSGPNLAATITPHHLMITMNDVRRGTFKPHLHCLPEAKGFEDRAALRKAAISGKPKFFLGTDSAPHIVETKECAECCAGIFNAPVALHVLATLFEELGALEQLEAFTSHFGADFYRLPHNPGRLTLVREEFRAPMLCPGNIRPFMHNHSFPWRIAART